MGTVTMIADAERSAHWVWNCAWKRWMPSGHVSSASLEPMITRRREVLAPRGQEVEQEHDGERRQRQRQQDLAERLELRAAVDEGGLLEVDGHRVVVALEDPDAERHRGHGVGDDQALVGADEVAA